MCGACPMRAHGAPNAAYSRQIMSQNHRCATPAIDPTKKPSLFEVWSLLGEFVAAGVPEHVRVGLELQGLLNRPGFAGGIVV